jgi:hypothetical protein
MKIPMFEQCPALAFLQNAYIANQARINSALTETAKKKVYQIGNPIGIVQRVPQHMLAYSVYCKSP